MNPLIDQLRSLLLLFSLAAIASGKCSHMPRPISPVLESHSACAKKVLHEYLLAFAWRYTNKTQSVSHLQSALGEAVYCKELTPALQEKLNKLKAALDLR